ncbi:hypothetical protein F5141DRAFT_1237370 [Pisolithus sp. B1]|nr:hypothetical protein F5141DRAFT_1237370 [Pisolithus sp. B1]
MAATQKLFTATTAVSHLSVVGYWNPTTSSSFTDSAKASAEYNYDALSERKVLRWVPTIPRNTIEAAREHLPDAELTDALSVNPGVVRSVGLYKVMGETVQAVIGGVYHQFGGSVAHRLFHTRILPHILLPNQHGGVPMEFHARALSISERMAGLEAKEPEAVTLCGLYLPNLMFAR